MTDETPFTDAEPVRTSSSSTVERLYERSESGECALLCPTCSHRFRLTPVDGLLRNTAVGERIRFVRAAVGLVFPPLRPPNRKYQTQGFSVVVYSARDKIECDECQHRYKADEITVEIETPDTEQQKEPDQ